MSVIPDFTDAGLLPEGIHRVTWDEVVSRFGWNTRRRLLLKGLKEALDLLKQAGCRRIYLNGSFVTAKELPNDFDACWEVEGVDPDALDPVLLDFANSRAAQKERFGGELFPAHWPASITGETFLAFFQRDRDGNPKGIVEINLIEGG